jgi:hypothetical protein
LTIERTTDYRIVKNITGCDPLISNEVIYLLDDGNLWSFHKDEDALRIHANMTNKKGKEVIESARRAFDWVFDNTPYKKIVARIPKENKPACFIANQCMNFINKDARYHYEVTHV